MLRLWMRCGLIVGIEIVLLTGLVFAEAKPRLAVLSLIVRGAQPEEAEGVAEELRNALVNSGNFVVVDRTLTGKIIEEWETQATLTEREKVIKIGSLFNVQRIVTGKLISFRGGGWQVSFVMMDAQSGVTHRTATVRHKGDFFSLLDQKVPALAAKLAAAKTAGGSAPAVVRQVPAAPAPAPAQTRSEEIPIGQDLTGSQIKQVLTGKTISGYGTSGNRYSVTFDEDGSISIVSGDFRDQGKWWIKDNTYCAKWKKIRDGRVACLRVVRFGGSDYKAIYKNGRESKFEIE